MMMLLMMMCDAGIELLLLNSRADPSPPRSNGWPNATDLSKLAGTVISQWNKKRRAEEKEKEGEKKKEKEKEKRKRKKEN